ncbi:MAG: hypothetical protein K6G67_08980 [Lachnospiraceae bacterium]|nr:hypothetical protein [Lachnospiraceae bacterium]
MNRSFLKICISFLILVFLCGCKNDEYDFAETTITVEKRGKVKESIVENFDKDYYNLEELKTEFTASVDAYNESIGGDEIKLRNIELKKDSKIYVDLEFTGPSDYESFVGEKLFVGTVSDAYDNGYTMDVVLKGVEKGDKIDKLKIMSMADRNIIIMSEHARIRTFKDIAYVSANVDVIDSNEARVLSESDGLAYLILE